MTLPMQIYSGFNPGDPVTNYRALFGHNRPKGLLHRCVQELRLGTNFQVIGERRSGKTSLLKCIESMLTTGEYRILPIYLNYRFVPNVTGTSAAYRYLLAVIHSTITPQLNASLTSQHKIFDTLPKSANPEECFVELQDEPDYKIRSLIADYITVLHNDSRGIALLFDEYEHLMLKTFGGEQASFFFIRDLPDRFPRKLGQPKALAYVIAGARPWHELVSQMGGSPELNKITAQFYVSPLEQEPFTEMWSHCFENTSPDLKQKILDSSLPVEDIYALSGGWPFFGKLIGDHLATDNYEGVYEAARSHFETFWSHLTDVDRVIIAKILNNDNISVDDSSFGKLNNLGLTQAVESSSPKLRGTLWSRFVKERYTTQMSNPVADNTANKEVTEQPKMPEKKPQPNVSLLIASALVAVVVFLATLAGLVWAANQLPLLILIPVIIAAVLFDLVIIAFILVMLGVITRQQVMAFYSQSILSKIPSLGIFVAKTPPKNKPK